MDIEHPSSHPNDGFSNAEVMASLAGVEEVKTPTESNASVIVERRRAGSVEIEAVMCAHVEENAGEIAEALRGCDVLAFEGVGHKDEAERRKYEQSYTALISSKANSDAVDRAFAEIAEKGFGVAGILSHLRGTDKRVVLLDINKDSPDFSAVEEAVRAREVYADAVVNLAPLQEARSVNRRSVQLTAQAYQIRDGVLLSQLQGLLADMNETEPDSKLGIMVGSMHYEAIVAVGEGVDPASEQVTRERIAHHLSLYDQAVESVRMHLPERSVLCDKALLSAYFATLVYSPAQSALCDELVGKLDDTQLDRILSALGDYLDTPMELSQDARKDISAFLQATADLLSNS